MSRAIAFSYRSARSASLMYGICGLVAVDAIWVHVLLANNAGALLAWAVDLLNAAAIALVIAEYRAMGRGVVVVDRDRIRLRIGWKYDAAVEHGNVLRSVAPTFRDLPQWGSVERRDFADLTSPARANVLLEFAEPVEVRIFGPFRRTVKRVALHLDDAAGFLAAVSEARAR